MKTTRHVLIATLLATPFITRAADPTKRSFLNPNQGSFFEISPAYSRWQGDGYSGNMGGGLVSLGVNAYESDLGFHQFSIQVGGLAGGYTDSASIGSVTASAKVDNLAVPVLANYNYVFKITDEFHAYLGATAGIVYIDQRGDEITVGSTVYSASIKATGLAAALGVNAGISYEITRNASLGFGYKYAYICPYSRDISGTFGSTSVSTSDRSEGISSHTFMATLSYLF